MGPASMVVMPAGPNSAASPMWTTIFRSALLFTCASAQPVHITRTRPTLSMTSPFTNSNAQKRYSHELRARSHLDRPRDRLRLWRLLELPEEKHPSGPVPPLELGLAQSQDARAEHHSVRMAEERIPSRRIRQCRLPGLDARFRQVLGGSTAL